MDDDPSGQAPLVTVLGATGYVGGRLVPRLLQAGYRVRCLVRSPGKLATQPWGDRVEVVRGDVTDRDDVAAAVEGAVGVYHLVHQMGSADDFAAADRRAALNVAGRSAAAGVRRIVYLGGLGEVDGDSSRHLASRGEVADILTAGSVPTTVLRAAVIIGSGSASFEMLRHLTEKLPFMVCPRWVDTRVQPIAIRDVLRYLIAAMDTADGADHDVDIGGPDVLTYREMMQGFARVAGLRRRVIATVPLLTPTLSSHWVNYVTPVPFGLARPLVQSLGVDVVVREDRETGRDLDPGPCLPYEEAVRLALKRVADREVETSWREADLAGRSPAEPYPGDPDWAGGVLLRDVRAAQVGASAEATFRAVSRIGGGRGWPTHGWAWMLRGWMDSLVGGVGLRRGRRDPDEVRLGDAIDFWRVEEVHQGRLLRLRAEMRLPGQAWLEFRVEHDGDPDARRSVLHQRALFAPRGLLGRLYWWVLVPFHGPIFSSMVQALARDAEEIEATQQPPAGAVAADAVADHAVAAGAAPADAVAADAVAADAVAADAVAAHVGPAGPLTSSGAPRPRAAGRDGASTGQDRSWPPARRAG